MGHTEDENDRASHVHEECGSMVSKEVKRLFQASVNAIDKRERLPQPLFWSLFHTQIRSIKKKKDRSRILRELLERI